MLVGKCDGCHKMREDITVTNSVKVCINCLDKLEEIVKLKQYRNLNLTSNNKKNQKLQKDQWLEVVNGSMNNTTKSRLISINALDNIDNYKAGKAWTGEKGFFENHYDIDPRILNIQVREERLRETTPGIALSVEHTLQKHAEICSNDKKTMRLKKW